MRIHGLDITDKMIFSSERKKLLKEFEALPYQRVNDSPTVKHYTDWSQFETAELTLSSDGVSVTLSDVKEAESVCSEFPHDTKLVPLVEALALRKVSHHSGTGRIELNAKGRALVPANLKVYVRDSAEITIKSNSRDGSLSAFLIEVEVPKDVTAKINLIADSDTTSLVFGRLRIVNNGNIELNLVSSTAKAGRLETEVRLGERASSKFLIRSLGKAGSIDNVINVYHNGPESVSEGTMKGSAFENAQVVIRGVASILENAHDSSTSIIGRSYVQGQEAKTIVVPMLEVKTGRVRMAKHSASAMKVPEDLLFYLQSRGFSKREANAIIVRGFLENPDDSEEIKGFIDGILNDVL